MNFKFFRIFKHDFKLRIQNLKFRIKLSVILAPLFYIYLLCLFLIFIFLTTALVFIRLVAGVRLIGLFPGLRVFMLHTNASSVFCF